MISYKKLGVAITTYSDENTPPHRYAMINNCFESLASVPGIIVNIVSDGITARHRKIIKGYPQFNHIERPENGGVAKAKNTSIRVLLEQNVDIGFLADDDLIFKRSDVFIVYATAVIKTGIPHFCFYQDNEILPGWQKRHEPVTTKLIRNFPVRRTPLVMGPFLTFTPEIVHKMGYFKVFGYKFGHEHSNFTIRCKKQGFIPYFCDITNACEYLTMDARSLQPGGHSLIINWKGVWENGQEYLLNLADYHECLE